MLKMAGQISDVGFGPDGLYRVRIRLQSKKGGKKRGTFSETIFGETKAKAHSKAKDRIKSLSKEKHLPKLLDANRQTLAKSLDLWLTEVKSKQIEVQTVEDYRKTLDRYIKPIGKLKLNKITREMIQDLYDEMQVGPRTVRYLNMILKSAYREFIAREWVAKNPCDGVILPKAKRRVYQVFSKEELQLFINKCEPFWQTLFLFVTETGLRTGEFLALKWSDVDLVKKKIKVERTIVFSKNGQYKFGPPKTALSRRTIPLRPKIVALLKAHRKRQLEARMKTGPYWTDLDLVFPTELGTPFTLTNVNVKFQKRLYRAGLAPHPIKPHLTDQTKVYKGFRIYDLRHTCATWLLEAGENLKVVSERLGHSSIRVTADTYLHVSEGMQAMATLKMGEILDSVKIVSEKER